MNINGEGPGFTGRARLGPRRALNDGGPGIKNMSRVGLINDQETGRGCRRSGAEGIEVGEGASLGENCPASSGKDAKAGLAGERE